MNDDVKSREILIQELEEARRELAEQAKSSRAEKMAALERLAGGVAHDVNNALTGIMGYTSVLLRSFEPGTSEYEDLDSIQRAAARIRALTRQLQAFGRRLSPQLVETNLNHLMGDLAPKLREMAGAQIQLDVDLSLDLGTVRVDPEQIQWVLMDLVQNAREATPPGGRVMLETANVELVDECTCQCGQTLCGPYVMLSVRDTGAGMDDRTLAQAFDPFFTTKGRRAGMGLPVAYGIVVQNGGHIAIESAPGRGTTVRIYLPRASGVAQSVAASPAAEVAGKNLKVLLVDDEVEVRRLAKRLLMREGHEVLEAEDGESALRLFGATRVDLLVTDMGLPGALNGRQLAEKAVAHWPDLKVLFISGSSYDRADFPQACTLLDKPFTPAKLLATVRQVIGE